MLDGSDDGDGSDIGSTEGMKEEDPNDENEKLKRAFTDSFEHLSQFDPDDELIKSDRSISMIESYMCRDGNGSKKSVSSATSEFSIISGPSVKSMVFSALSSIEQQAAQISFIEPADEDNYLQDIIA